MGYNKNIFHQTENIMEKKNILFTIKKNSVNQRQVPKTPISGVWIVVRSQQPTLSPRTDPKRKQF
jgi:hypothetical protein